MRPSEIKDWLEDMWNILVDLNISIKNAKRLIEVKYENEEKVKDHGFIRHHWYQLQFILVIQLSKLIASNKNTHKRNIFFLCEKLEATVLNDNFFIELKEFQPIGCFEPNSPEISIRKLVVEIKDNLYQNNERINKIVNARNQTYAHNDPIPGKKVPSMNDLEIIVQLCNDIYNRLSSEFFKSTTGFEYTSDWDIDYILKELCLGRTQRLNAINLRRNKGI